jgi:uncharacterized protein YutE (UPF0331/DUF86 family)
MSPEQAIVESLLAAMDENVSLLETMKAVSRQEFTADPRQYLFAERCFQLAIQCLVDAAFRLAADEGWPKPQDGAAAIRLLGEKRVLPLDFVNKIGGIVAFRNVLVHAYLHINRGIVHEKLAELGDFRQYQRHVLAYLSARGQKGTR